MYYMEKLLITQPLRDWHLAVILLILTGIGVLLMVIRTSTQFATESPFLVPDKENSEGRTVGFSIYILTM